MTLMLAVEGDCLSCVFCGGHIILSKKTRSHCPAQWSHCPARQLPAWRYHCPARRFRTKIADYLCSMMSASCRVKHPPKASAILASREHLGMSFWHLGNTMGGHLTTSGPPWRTMGAAGWTRSCPSQDLGRFWKDVGTSFYLFLWFKMHIFSFSFLNLFPNHFLSLSDLNVRRVGVKNRCFRIEDIDRLFVEIFLKEFQDRLECLLDALGTVFLIC
jgi:hypothetical protein